MSATAWRCEAGDPAPFCSLQPACKARRRCSPPPGRSSGQSTLQSDPRSSLGAAGGRHGARSTGPVQNRRANAYPVQKLRLDGRMRPLSRSVRRRRASAVAQPKRRRRLLGRNDNGLSIKNSGLQAADPAPTTGPVAAFLKAPSRVVRLRTLRASGASAPFSNRHVALDALLTSAKYPIGFRHNFGGRYLARAAGHPDGRRRTRRVGRRVNGPPLGRRPEVWLSSPAHAGIDCARSGRWHIASFRTFDKEIRTAAIDPSTS